MPDTLLVARDLGVSYPGLDLRVDLEVGRGELLSILGPSGSGKTTTLRLLAGFEKPTTGTVALAGKDITALPPEKRRIGIVFQDYALFPHMDVAGNVTYGLLVRGLAAHDREREAARWLDRVGLAGFERRDVRTLSGGEQQRVALARSLAVSPILVLLDEPFSSIDPVLRRELRGRLTALQKDLGISMVFVTHSQEEALAISDRVLVLNQGHVAQVGTAEDLYRRPSDRFVAGFVGEATLLPGRVSRVDDYVTVAGVRELRVRPPPSGVRVGEGVTICVRPDRLRPAGPGEVNAMETVVTACQYYGHYHAHTCRIIDATPPDDLAVVYDARRHAVGRRIHVAFDPEDAWLLA